MHWDVLGAISEIAGAIALIVTLSYIVKQIGIQSKQLQRTVNHEQQFTICTDLAAFNAGRQSRGDLS